MRYHFMLMRTFVLVVFMSIYGCAQLPEYAKPHFNLQLKEGTDDPDAFGYRRLTRDDFQATALPGNFAQYSHRINARSCLGLRTSKETHLRLSKRTYFGRQYYVGRVEGISYRAVFKPSCSWWNSKIHNNRIAYVLQHEQIHFALLEIAARKVSRSAEDELETFIAVGTTVEDVKQEFLEKAKTIGQDIMRENIKVHTAFDEETSLYFDPRAQQKWFVDVVERLEKESNHSAPD